MKQININGFKPISEKEATVFIQMMFEYSSLHDLLKKTCLEAYADFIANKPTTEALLRLEEHYSEAISSSCGIITDLMLKRCRELMQENTE